MYDLIVKYIPNDDNEDESDEDTDDKLVKLAMMSSSTFRSGAW